MHRSLALCLGLPGLPCLICMYAAYATRGWPDLRVELAVAHGMKLGVSKRERLEQQTVADPIPALFVCVLPDGPLKFGGS